MKIPYSWLQEMVAELPALSELTELCDGLGLAVEQSYRYPGAAEGTVAVLIESLEQLAGSEHLRSATVYDGHRRVQVVTGAPNARVGMVTAYAAPGTRLTELGEVGEREIAGMLSAGVLLSPRELGVFDYAGGLIELPADLEPGADLARQWPGDEIIELELTPNRADAFSILGVARDVAAKLGVPYRHPAAGLQSGDPELDDGLTIEVADDQACPGFTLRRIDEVTVAPSPLWLQRRLASVGLRPRNNIVDVTNYVTFELGQPSHAYDAEGLSRGTVQVRLARPDEKLTTLTGDELRLEGEDLVIATPDGEGSRAIGLAGVVGGLEDSVETGTRTLALEVAHFDPATVRRTAKRHGLSTDAHYRFERGVDPALPPLASARASALIAELAGGRLHPGVSQVGGAKVPPPISFRPSRVGFLMDFQVPLPAQRGYLEALGCSVAEQSGTGPEANWQVVPPSWRFDLAIEEDLVEEVARLHGFEHIGETIPVMHFVPRPGDPTHRGLRDDLVALGFQEAVGYVFTSPAESERAAAPAPAVRLAEPQGIERSVLRTALYPGLLTAAAFNRSAASLAMFEVGRVFLEEERERVALMARGPWVEPGWQSGAELDFFLFKGLLERLARLRNAELEMFPATDSFLHPGIAAEVRWNGRPVGRAGRLHPEVAARYELGDLYLAELELPLESGSVRFRQLPRQPHAERDVAVVAPRQVSYRELRELVAAVAGEQLESVEPFDVYEGEPVPEGSRSLALRLRFRHPERALGGEEVDVHMQNVIGTLRARGYDIRDR